MTKSKMQGNYRNRSLYVVGTLLLTVLGLFTAFCALHPDFFFGKEIEYLFWKRIVTLCAGLYLVSFSLYLLLSPLKKEKDIENYLIRKTESGELRISQRAVENIVQKCVQLQEGLSLSSIKTAFKRDEVEVSLCITVSENVSIPEIVDNLQKNLLAQLKTSVGIENAKLIVSVSETVNDAV